MLICSPAQWGELWWDWADQSTEDRRQFSSSHLYQGVFLGHKETGSYMRSVCDCKCLYDVCMSVAVDYSTYALAIDY